jgi:hypothetical protein
VNKLEVIRRGGFETLPPLFPVDYGVGCYAIIKQRKIYIKIVISELNQKRSVIKGDN